MIVHPLLQALRGDDSPQRHAQNFAHDMMKEWRMRPDIQAIYADLAAFGHGRPMVDCPSLHRLFEEGDSAAQDLAQEFAQIGAQALRGAPLAHLPQRHSCGKDTSTLVLGRSGLVTLSLAAVDGSARGQSGPPQSVSFWPGEAWEQVLAGSAQGFSFERRTTTDGACQIIPRNIALQTGKVLCRDASRQAVALGNVSGTLVSLRLQRRSDTGAPAREYCVQSGALLHQSAGSVKESRTELMMALLGRMGRSDAAPMMAEVALEKGSDDLRWQALRECLGLDTGAGYSALCNLADRPEDSLSTPANSLRSQLQAAYPQLVGIE